MVYITLSNIMISPIHFGGIARVERLRWRLASLNLASISLKAVPNRALDKIDSLDSARDMSV